MFTSIFLIYFLHLASQTSHSLISFTTLLLLRTLYLFQFFFLSLNFGVLSPSLFSVLYSYSPYVISFSLILSVPQWLPYLYIQPWPLTAYSLQLIWPFHLEDISNIHVLNRILNFPSPWNSSFFSLPYHYLPTYSSQKTRSHPPFLFSLLPNPNPANQLT